MMRFPKSFLVLVGIVALLIGGLLVMILMPGDADNSSGNGIFLPGAGDEQPGGKNEMVRLLKPDGSFEAVPDFTKGKQRIDQGEGYYHYRLTTNQETLGPDAPYDIIYDGDGSISIGIFKEPLKDTRKAAEAELLRLVGIDEAEACSLVIMVFVPVSVNSQYSGNDLGLSFCPGSVTLP